MLLKSPVSKSDQSINDKIGKAIFAGMVSFIVTYHGLDSARKLCKMGAEVGDKVGSYFNNKKDGEETEKATKIK